MSSKILSTANPSLHLHYSKHNQSSTKKYIQRFLQFTRLKFTDLNRQQIGAADGPIHGPKRGLLLSGGFEGDTVRIAGDIRDGEQFLRHQKTYKQMARKFHPDVSPPDRVDENTKRFIQVHEAYETLSDPQTRAMYDRALAGGFGFSFSKRKSDQEMEKMEEWRTRWESQLDGLNRRGNTTSWGARMRSQR